MAHQRAFWEWAIHAPLRTKAGASARRKQKLRAIQARLQFVSLYIESWGFYAFVAKLDEHPALFWYGGQPGRGATESADYDGYLSENLSALFSQDRARYQHVIAHALDPDRVDAYGYPNMWTLLETTEALLSEANPPFRLLDFALVRVRQDLLSGRVAKSSWVNDVSKGPWMVLRISTRIHALQVQIEDVFGGGSFVPASAPRVPSSERDNAEYSDFEAEGESTAFHPHTSKITATSRFKEMKRRNHAFLNRFSCTLLTSRAFNRLRPLVLSSLPRFLGISAADALR